MTPDPVETGEAGDPVAPDARRVPLWDLSIRLVHWSFVLLLPTLWWTYKSGRMGLHSTLGYIMLGLLVYRIYWGFVGGGAARFGSFMRGPRAIFAYLKSLFSKSAEPVVGHNPIGALSVVALLLMLLAQVVIGLFAQDTDGLVSGPLTKYVSYDMADAARDLHETGFNIILGLVGLHLFAIAFYLVVKRDNLIGPMLTGHKRVPLAVKEPHIAPAWRAIIGVGLGTSIAWWVSLGCPIIAIV